jgi:multiple sugar transport system ATP-binding protein
VAPVDQDQQAGWAAPSSLYHRPDNVFVAGFIGSPSMNLAEAHLDDDGSPTIVLGDRR